MSTQISFPRFRRLMTDAFLFVSLAFSTAANGEPTSAEKIVAAAATVSDRFEDVEKLDKTAIPQAGTAKPAFNALDEALLSYMADHGIPALTWAVSRNGKILHERAFGWADSALTVPMRLDQPIRIASNSKPLTRAMIYELAESKKLRLDDKVFDLLKLSALAPQDMDARWRDITIQHLIDHKGGWDREKSPVGDFATNSQRLAKDLGIKLEALKPMDLVRWALGKPLDFTPGERSAYGNFAYMLLARVAEEVTGQPFIQVVKETAGKESGMTTLRLSRTDAKDRSPGELWYCYHPQFTKKADILPFRLEPLDGSSAIACTAADYCRFMERYELDGHKRTSGYHYLHSGRMPGTCSMAVRRTDGTCFIFIANRSGPGGTSWEEEISRLMDKEIDRVAKEL